MKDPMQVGVNEVRLVGRVSRKPEVKSLPSGDVISTLRLVVARSQPHGRQTVDVVDCVAWNPRSRRTVDRWSEGDEVEVSGSLRRRFYRAGKTTQSRTEVEIIRGRLVRRTIVSTHA